MNPILMALVAIVGATVHTNQGPPLEKATVLIDNERIIAVGEDVEIPAHARRIDAQGMVVTPGFIDPWTQLGVVEIWGVGHTRDSDAGSGDAIRASYRVADSYNSDSQVIPIQRVHGVTSAMIVPTGGAISGQAAVINLGIQEPIMDSAGLVAHLGGGDGHARGQRLAELKIAFDDAKEYSKSKKAYRQNRLRPLAASARDLDAVYSVARGDRPLFLRVNRRSDIRSAVEWANEEGIRLVLVGAREAWKESALLAKHGVGVILDPVANTPSNFDTLDTRADSAILLDKAGVSYAFSTFSTHQVRKLRQWAGNAVREGLSYDAAMRAVTQRPAQLLGLKKRGVLAPGFVADLVLWSGDPFEFSSEAKMIFIKGQPVSKRHRQKALFERYRRLE